MKLDFTRYSLGFVMLAAMCLVSGFVQSGCDKRAPVAGDFKKAVENEKPVSTASIMNEFEGCTLIDPPKEIAAQDVALLRNFLKRETSTGVWEEIEWKQKILPSFTQKRWNEAEKKATDYVVAPQRIITAEIRTNGPLGHPLRTKATAEYYEDNPKSVDMRAPGFNATVERARYAVTSIAPE